MTDIIFKNKLSVITQCKYGPMIYFMTDDPIGSCLHFYGEWAEQEFVIFDKLLNENSVCIDLGANIGTHTIWLSKKCNHGLVYSVEPQFYIFQLLNTNIVLNDATNCVPINAFVMNYNGVARTGSLLASPENKVKVNYGEFNIEKYKHDDGVKTNVFRLDDYGFHKNKVDFIKIDCEGAESDVLMSGEKIISLNKPHMYLEFNDKQGNDNLLSVLKFLGYKCYWHVYPKFNKHNFRGATRNIWIFDHEVDIFPSVKDVDRHFEGNIVCIHKDKDISFQEEVQPGDTLIKYLLKHKMINE